jgi:hypothetical protein
MKSFGTKHPFAFLAAAILVLAILSACSAILPEPALAEGKTPQPPVQQSNQPVGAATFRYMCDGGKVTTVTIGRIPASLGILNTTTVPFGCAVLADYQVAEGYKLELSSQPLPGQVPDLPIVSDTIVTVSAK